MSVEAGQIRTSPSGINRAAVESVNEMGVCEADLDSVGRKGRIRWIAVQPYALLGSRLDLSKSNDVLKLGRRARDVKYRAALLSVWQRRKRVTGAYAAYDYDSALRSDELLSAVDVVRRAGERSIDHEMHGKCGHVISRHDTPDRQLLLEFGAPIIQLLPQQ